MPLRIPRTNAAIYLVSKSYDPANVVANTQADNATTITVTGAQPGDFVHVIKPTATQGLFVKQAYVSAADTVTVTFENITGSDINPGSETYLLIFIRPDGALLSSLS